jgi:hypothetical protein
MTPSRCLTLATEDDLAIAVRDPKIWTGSIAEAVVVIMVAAQHLWLHEANYGAAANEASHD